MRSRDSSGTPPRSGTSRTGSGSSSRRLTGSSPVGAAPSRPRSPPPRPQAIRGTRRARYGQARSLDLRLRRLRARRGRFRRLLLRPVLELDAAAATGSQLLALLRRYPGVAEAGTEYGHPSNGAVPSAAPHGLAPRGGRG